MRGFTAIELMVVVAIMAVLAALAGPSMMQTIQRYRMSAAADEWVGLVQFARTEAIRTRTVGIVQAKALSTCATGTDSANWTCGAVVFLDADGDAARGSNEPILRETNGNTALSVVHTGGTTASQLQFSAFGMSVNTPGQLVITPAGSGASNPTLTLCFSAVGRVVRKIDSATCS